MELAELGRPEELPPSWTFFNFKLIPSVKRGAPPEVMQLTSITLENVKVTQVYKGKATVEFGTSAADPLHKIPIKEVLGGVYLLFESLDLTYGEVLYDYLTEGR